MRKRLLDERVGCIREVRRVRPTWTSGSHQKELRIEFVHDESLSRDVQFWVITEERYNELLQCTPQGVEDDISLPAA